MDVTQPPYGAIPDDGGDDTEALQRALTENVDTGRTLYFPSGTYVVRDTLVCKNREGVWRPHSTIQGQSAASTRLVLADHAEGFQDASAPKAILVTGSHWEPGDAEDGGGNKAFRNNVFDISMDVGSGNPGAIAISYAASNQGAIRRVHLHAPRNSGHTGIAITRGIPGPALIMDVAITGFSQAVEVADIQYGITMENLYLSNQEVAGLSVRDNLLHIRRLHSSNSVPAIRASGVNSVVSILDSDLSGRAAESAVIVEGSFFAEDLRITGYRHATVHGKLVDSGEMENFQWPTAIGRRASSGGIPIAEAPPFWNADPADWEPVGPRRDGESDDTAAVQRAVDSGRSTVYFRNDRTYFVSDTIEVRGPVRQILGMGSEISLGAAEEPFSNRDRPRPIFRIGSTNHATLFLENLFFNAQYPAVVIFENDSPADLVIRHCAGWVGAEGSRRSYRSTARATGRLFLEDVFLPGWSVASQDVWARQFNPENWDGDGSTPQVEIHDGSLWVLGFKTEGPAPFVQARNARVTVVGAYHYVSAARIDPVPEDAVPYLLQDTQANLAVVFENFRPTDYRFAVVVPDGRREAWPPAAFPGRNGSPTDRSKVVNFGVTPDRNR